MGYFNQDNQRDDRRSFGGGGRRDFGGRGGRSGDRGDRRMYPAVCDKCGRDCEVPFQPDGSKPIFCSNCFEKKQSDFGQKRDNYDNRGGSQPQNMNAEVLSSINSKLAQILELMRSKEAPRKETTEKKLEKNQPKADKGKKEKVKK